MYDDKPLYQALVEQSRLQGCAGATALRGMAGYGASSRDVAKHGLAHVDATVRSSSASSTIPCESPRLRKCGRR